MTNDIGGEKAPAASVYAWRDGRWNLTAVKDAPVTIQEAVEDVLEGTITINGVTWRIVYA